MHQIDFILDLTLKGQTWPQLTVNLDSYQAILEFDQNHARAVMSVNTTASTSELVLTIAGLAPDTQISLESLSFFGVRDPRFLWAGIYRPCYPQPWASQQTHLPPIHTNITVLGWDGVWGLEITNPVFTWMHQKLGLGRIYSPG